MMCRSFVYAFIALVVVSFRAERCEAQARGSDFLPDESHTARILWLDADGTALTDSACQDIETFFTALVSTPGQVEYRLGYPMGPGATSPGGPSCGPSGPIEYVSLVAPQAGVLEDPYADFVFQFASEVESFVTAPEISSDPEIPFDPPVVDGLTYTYSHQAPLDPCTSYQVSIEAEVVLRIADDPPIEEWVSACGGFQVPPLPDVQETPGEWRHDLYVQTGELWETWFDGDESPRGQNLLLPADVSIGSFWVVNARGTTGEVVDMVSLPIQGVPVPEVLVVEYDVADSESVVCSVRDASTLWRADWDKTLVRFWWGRGRGILKGELYDCDGLVTRSFVALSATPVMDSPPPRDELILEVAPNPFNPRAFVRFSIPTAGPVLIRIYDAAGRRVRTLFDEWRPAGWHETHWDGRDGSGTSVASGAYLVQLQSGESMSTRRVVLLK